MALNVTVKNPKTYPDWAAFAFFPFEVPRELSADDFPPYNFGDYMLKRNLQFKAAWQLSIALIGAFYLMRA